MTSDSETLPLRLAGRASHLRYVSDRASILYEFSTAGHFRRLCSPDDLTVPGRIDEKEVFPAEVLRSFARCLKLPPSFERGEDQKVT